MRRASTTMRRIERTFLRALGIGLTLFLALPALLATRDLPEWACRPLRRALWRAGGAVETDGVRLLLPLGRVRLRGVRLYRRGVVGPPLLEARRVTLALDWLALA
ncbi:MAG: hypothetical protein EOM24_16520, partial [Chloroflexia bacterium]|nr:hypothetical protein [Chloroflexia bacterium]